MIEGILGGQWTLIYCKVIAIPVESFRRAYAVLK
jgi:hypothetical protein